MENVVETRVVEVLQREPAYTLPVRALHGALVAEMGRAPGTYGELRAALGRRPDLFVVMEPVDPLGETATWPADLRAEYHAALRAAGFDPEPRVALVPLAPTAVREVHRAGWEDTVPTRATPGFRRLERSLGAGRTSADPYGSDPDRSPAPGPLDAADASLVALWAGCKEPGPLYDTLATALSEIEELRRLLDQEIGPRNQPVHHASSRSSASSDSPAT
jgi:hypothetical protein